jgi:integrase
MKARLAAERAREQDAGGAAPFTGRLYDLRHTAITTLYLHALPDQVIRKIFGWTPSSRMPDIYVHVTRAHVSQAFDALAAVAGASPPVPITTTRPAAPSRMVAPRHPFLDRRQG